MSSGTITTENLKTSITAEVNTDALNNLFTYIMPFSMPGDLHSTEMNITTENIKTSITTEC